MLRRIVPTLVLVVAACSGADRDTVPAATELVGDSIGAPNSPALSPDGTRLAWWQPTEGKAAIYVGNADGSNPVQLTHGQWDVNPVWSPDGRWIAYMAEDPHDDLMVVPSNGGERRPLSSGPGQEDPAGWTPDGTGVVYYQNGRGEVQTLLAPLDGSPVHPVVPALGGDQWVAISPDGSKAVFDLGRGAQSTVWVQDMAGGAARQLTTEGFERLAPTRTAWAPDSRHVVFASRRTGTEDLWVVDVDSGEPLQLTHDVRNDNGAVWSPDGEWIAFLSDRGGQTDVWVIPSAGGKARRVTNDLAQEDALEWSRDGRSLIYQSIEVDGGLGVASLDGGTPRMLVDWPGYAVGAFVVDGPGSNVTLSPDGATVVFVSNRSGNPDLWSVPFAGGEPVAFATSPLKESEPRYSPDGSQVLFGSNRSGSADLWVMPAFGGEARQLTNWPSDEFDGHWSPDGKSIAFRSNQDGTGTDIWLMPSSGGSPSRLTHFRADIGGVQWSPDGSGIYAIVTQSSGTQRLYRVPVAGGAPVALRMAPSAGAGILSPDGSQYAYAAFDGGFAFVEVTPTAGGAPRRITRRSEGVYQGPGAWSPDGSHIAVADWLYGGNDATADVVELSVSDGAERRLTQIPRSFESPVAYTADGTGVLFVRYGIRSHIMSVVVADLLARAEEAH
jgi:Tol biopolymer transport system component